ncbi:MAG: hypothetical protein AAFX54_12830 [Pseudomonadota bacterium]
MNKTPPTPQANEGESTELGRESNERLALTLDMETYLGQLDDWEISESHKREFIVTFWNLLVTFAEIGFEIHPVQLARRVGEKAPENLRKTKENPAFEAENMLYSKSYYRTQIIDTPAADFMAESKDSNSEEQRS